MHHLGTWVSALVDGQLGPAESERALAHVAACAFCAHELAAARQARRTLSIVADVEPAPDLTARLLALGAEPRSRPDVAATPASFAVRSNLFARRRNPSTGPGSPSAGPGNPSGGRPSLVLPLGSPAYSVPARALTGELTGRRRFGFRRVTGSAAAGLGVVAASLFLLGARPAVVPSAHPAQALSMLGSANSATWVRAGEWTPELATQITMSSRSGAAGASGAAVLEWMDEAGWTSPVEIPEGYQVTAARLGGVDGAVLEIDLAGQDGPMVLTEQRGWLNTAALVGASEIAIGDQSVFVLTRQPWHVVWQADDTVVSLVADSPTDAAAALVAGFPVAGYDDGVTARITRGWDTVTGAWERP